MKKIILIVLPFVILLSAVILFTKFKDKLPLPVSNPTKTVSGLPAAELKSVPDPIFRFQGRIEKIDGQILIVAGVPLPELPAAATSSSQLVPSLTMRITINPETKISQLSTTNSASNSAKLAFRDLKAGQSVIITSPNDLRQLKTAEFSAQTIELLPASPNSLQGKTVDQQVNILTEDNPAAQTKIKAIKIEIPQTSE